jgi:hypothetical protein
MLALSILIHALVTTSSMTNAPNRPLSKPSPAVTSNETLSDEELRSRITNYLGAIDVAPTVQEWRALGLRAVPILEKVVSNRDGLPSRRAAAIGALAVIGGEQARQLVLRTAHAENEPFVVRAAALHGAHYFLKSGELTKELTPVLQSAREPETRAAAAEVLAEHAPKRACPAIRAQVERERGRHSHFVRALERCGLTQ